MEFSKIKSNITLYTDFDKVVTINNLNICSKFNSKINIKKENYCFEIKKYKKKEGSKKKDFGLFDEENNKTIFSVPPFLNKKIKIHKEEKKSKNDKKIIKDDELYKLKKLINLKIIKNDKKNNEINQLRYLIGLEPIELDENKKNTDFSKNLIYEKNFNKINRKKKIKLTYYYDLCFILNKILLGNIPKIDFLNISPLKHEILLTILLRKYEKYLNNSIIKKIQREKNFKKKILIFLELLQTENFKISLKKNDQKMKMIFSISMKKLKIKFFNINNLKNNKNLKRKSNFYKFYFDSKENLNLLEKIQMIKKKKSKHHFNQKELFLYFMSKKFKSEFLIYLNWFFKENYLNNLNKKLENYFKNYEKKYVNNIQSGKQIISDIKKSKKFKFPWNIYEIEDGILKFNNLIRNL